MLDFTYIISYNISRWFYEHHFEFLAKVTERVGRVIYSCDIPYTANIAKTAVFAHKGLGVVLGDDVIIGSDTIIMQNVTIGGRHQKNSPYIGNCVLIGAGASILGDIKIDDGAKIGANAVVLSNVPKQKTVVGVPAHIVK